MGENIWLWVGFNAFVIAMLMLDLVVFNRQAHEIKLRESLVWTAVWICMALSFAGIIYYLQLHPEHGIKLWGPSKRPAIEFLTGYLIEKSLSTDNLFVFLLIFSYFRIEPKYQHRVLFWGILGALVMRALFIGAGIVLIHRFEWIMYVFGAFLIYTGVKMAFGQDEEVDPGKNPVYRLFRRWMDTSHSTGHGRFFVRVDGRLRFTPIFVVLLVVETTDVIFALDSIPAVLAVSTDPFIVFSSNVFAILGLRALYFALAGMMQIFHHLHYGLSLILAFVGVKMIIKMGLPMPGDRPNLHYEIPTGWALGAIGAVLALSIIASYIWPEKEKPAQPGEIKTKKAVGDGT